ncbi:MAG: hypothetical protein LBC64_03165 [Fibromonadaceae bacterium]|nr:hypothetical protein [Fibromonadaceae bacterium]
MEEKTEREKLIAAEIRAIAKEAFAETNLILKELSRRIGGIDDNQGYHAEQYFQNALAENLVFGGIKYDVMVPNLAYKDKDGEIEFDIALMNGNSIALIEVKNRIHPKFVRELAEDRIEKFRKFFPKYKNFKTYLGLAGFSYSKKVLEEARKYGIGLIRQRGDTVEMKADSLRMY